MADKIILNATKREGTGSQVAKKLRRQGVVPAIVYGASQDTYPIAVNAKEFGDIMRHSQSEQILVTLEIEGAKEKSKMALIQNIQHNPLTGQVLHIDFNAVQADAEIHAQVPIHTVGEAVGVKAGGLIEQHMHDMEVHCLPSDLPSHIDIDVSELNIGDSIHVADVNFPKGVAPGMEADVIVVICNESSAAKADDAAIEEEATAAAAEPERIGGAKEDGDADAGKED